MPVEVKFKKPPPLALGVADFEYPGESNARKLGIGLAAAIYVVLILVGLLIPPRPIIAGVVFLWVVGALLYFGPIGESSEAKPLASLQRRPEPKPSAAPKPEAASAVPAADVPAEAQTGSPLTVQEMVDRQAQVVGIKPPAIVLAESARTISLVGRTVVLPATIKEHLTQGEIWSLLASEMGDLKAGHVQTLNLCRRVARAHPLVRSIIGLPASILCALLGNWQVLAQFTADRMALLLTRDRKVCGSALVKISLHSSEEAAEVSSTEVAEYFGRRGKLEAKEAELTTHFKLGQFIRENPVLSARLSELSSYSDSEDFKRALKKTREILQQASEQAEAQRGRK